MICLWRTTWDQSLRLSCSASASPRDTWSAAAQECATWFTTLKCGGSREVSVSSAVTTNATKMAPPPASVLIRAVFFSSFKIPLEPCPASKQCLYSRRIAYQSLILVFYQHFTSQLVDSRRRSRSRTLIFTISPFSLVPTEGTRSANGIVRLIVSCRR